MSFLYVPPVPKQTDPVKAKPALAEPEHEYVLCSGRSIGDSYINKEAHAVQAIIHCTPEEFGSELQLCLYQYVEDELGASMIATPIDIKVPSAWEQTITLTGLIPPGAEYIIQGSPDNFTKVVWYELKSVAT
ncbi:hypothetical protein AB2S62_21715 [Vibrio sp. NTOU-M3]|uniref:hypothetical protein n=1 Tax=Vibrio sp. NTOU-M3 TaxID=3234954 RepID=UPI00349F838F